MLRHVHMPTQHMCIEQDKKCFSFSQNEKHNASSIMHEAAEVRQKMKEHEYKIKIVKTLISSYYSVNLCSRENN